MPDPHAHKLSIAQFMAAKADQVLSDLVPMAALVDAANAADNKPLGRARISDAYEPIRDLCPCHLRALLVVAAVELARMGWAPEDHPDALAVDINAPLPDAPPEVTW